MIGNIVCSKKGRDKDRFMVVVGLKDGMPLVCDGKERPLERPKCKNIKHLAFTKCKLKEEQFSSNRALRKSLREYREVTPIETEE